MDLKDTISGFKGVLEGKYDDLPEMAFYMCATAFSACAWYRILQRIVNAV